MDKCHQVLSSVLGSTLRLLDVVLIYQKAHFSPKPTWCYWVCIRICDFQIFNMVSIAKSMRYDGWDDLVFNLLLTKLTALKERKGVWQPKEFFEMYTYAPDAYIWEVIVKIFFFQFSMLRNTCDEFWCFEIEGHGEGYCDFESYVLRQSFDPSVLIFI